MWGAASGQGRLERTKQQISPVLLAVRSKLEREVSVDPLKTSGAPNINKGKSFY